MILIRHATATHFWLNEGFTTYMERVLQEKLHSPAHRGFSYVIGEKGLKDDFVRFIDEQQGRLVGQSLEPIESSIEVRHRSAWPTHCEEVDKHWNPFVDNVVQLGKNKPFPSCPPSVVS